MTGVLWLLLFATAAAFGWLIWRNVRNWQARHRAEAERFADFMAETTGAAVSKEPVPTPVLPAAALSAAPRDDLPLQKLLYDAAHKAGEAGEPALAIQLYARLLARFPASTLASPARAAVEAQKKKLPKV
jgi:hypothetical protein